MFAPTTESLVWMCLVGFSAYGVASIMLIATRLGYERRLRVLERVRAQLDGQSPKVIDGPNEGRRLALDTLAGTPLGDVMLLACDSHASRPEMELFAQSLLARLGVVRVRAAAQSRRVSGENWRRIAALRTLAFARSDQSWECLDRALADGGREVKAATVTLLGQLGDRRSAALLVGAMRAGSFSRSRIAASLDAFSIDIGDLVAPLVASADTLVRFWATTLMQRYPQTPDLARQVIALTNDTEPLVRKAAIDAIVAIDVEAVNALRTRLTDDIPFVRAHAARSLGRLQGASASRALLPLLADRDWTVRDAAKESLGAMGATIVPAVFPVLAHPDAFARNSAAEVLQNVGVFERLLVLETAGLSDPERVRSIHLLVRAGGAGMWESVVERLNLDVRPGARQLLGSMDLQRPFVQEIA
jgi:HEAT repeat protein